ncbi:NERD domain-containing protein [Neobacillus notoginsengisoli]|uniref:NERD domain-containing protein n=2 Tax=Neobacillus notoginsengisoli TaxID=1578198 RepID=A0A417Z1C7_9BACI|nr:NERD domain-containing protein [Neobacillus notoginsengisoli]
MDFYKKRTPSAEMLALRSLYLRMGLADSDRNQYFNLIKGYQGEVLFDGMTKNLTCDCIILNDLLLSFGGNEFQIDTLMIYSALIYLIDVKNFEGDHLYDKEKLYRLGSDYELKNPLNQIQRCETQLHQMLQSLGWKLPIHPSVIFINPDFTLYQTPIDRPFLYRSQLNRFLQKLNQTPSKLTAKHWQLAEKIASLHQTQSKNTKLPAYTYGQLKKGNFCEKCESFSVTVKDRTMVCGTCEHKEPVGAAIMRAVREFGLLFPGERLTTNIIMEWCGIIPSKKCIQNTLGKHLEKCGVGRGSYYVFK